jgi:hypothetical protein
LMIAVSPDSLRAKFLFAEAHSDEVTLDAFFNRC